MDTGGAEAAIVEREPAFDFEKPTSTPAARSYSENVNCADFADEEEMQDVVESFEQLHRSIPWLQRAGVSSESHRGQLQILQAAIDYIIDLEEQLTDQQLSGDLYRAAFQSGRAVLQQSLAAAATAAAAAASRRPFADVNAGPPSPSPPSSVSTQSPQRVSPNFSLSAAGLSDPSITGAGDRQC